MTVMLEEGYRPGCIGRIVQLHAEYCARASGFGMPFELKVARGLYEKHGFRLAHEEPGNQWGQLVTEQVFVRGDD